MWITYPGDFEIWLGNIFNNRRTERGAMFPPFWRQYSHYVTVEFSTTVNLDDDEEVEILTEGQFNFMLDGKLQYGMPKTFTVPKGEHKLNFKVWNQSTPPALWVASTHAPYNIKTGATWKATVEDKIWIDENGVAHGSGIYVPAATSPFFTTKEQKPSQFKLPTTPMMPVLQEDMGKGRLFDFGKETMGMLVIDGAKDKGCINIYYGESREEALDKEHCETLDKVDSHDFTPVILDSKAYRYVYVEMESGVSVAESQLSVYMFYEYSEHDAEKSGAFECSDPELNKIWEVGAYTMDLTTREFFMDGIKRDRWTWSGDAIQSYLMNYYLRFDSDCVKRTIRQLRGKDPVTSHVNTILDYTFYWFNSISDYYLYTGDKAFIKEMYPRMLTMMDYVLGRLHDDWAIGQSDDWIFVDWVDFPMHKRGVLCFEQILFARSLQTMQMCKDIVGPLSELEMTNLHLSSHSTLVSDPMTLIDFGAMAKALLKKIDDTFWNEQKKGYMHALEPSDNGELTLNADITKFPNMFQIIYGNLSAERSQTVKDNVMLNPEVEAITTPYMRFYELEALCKMGQHDHVMSEMKDYWGGMLKEGATSFWEKYVPTEHGTQHLQMYGRPYGKSLCHAWGASPVYLLGKYYLGISPVKPGYAEWECRPHLGSLEWMKGKVPTPFGPISITMDKDKVVIKSPIPNGKVYINEVCYDVNTTDEITFTL